MRVLTQNELSNIAGAYLDTSSPWFQSLSPEEQAHMIEQEQAGQDAADEAANDANNGANGYDSFFDTREDAWWM